MLNIIKVILFVIVNVAGLYTIPVLANMALKMDVFPSLPPGHHTEVFKFWFLGIGMWVWIACAFVSVGYFFFRNEIKNWLLLSPLFGTAIFGTAVLIYFNFIYSVV